jgi:hypothetical protein
MGTYGILSKKRDSSKSFFDENGKTLTVLQAKKLLLNLNKEGYILYPCCGLENCPDFDKAKGCPGHEEPKMEGSQQ